MILYDTCALLQLKEGVLKEAPFAVSTITLNELEHIKTCGTKSEEVKYAARQVIKLLRDNHMFWHSIMWNPLWNLNILLKGLPLNNDSKISYSAYKNHFDFCTADSCCGEIARALGIKVIYPQNEDNDIYLGYKEISMTEEQLADFYSNTLKDNVNRFSLLNNQYLLINSEDKIVDRYKWSNNSYEKVKFQKFDSRTFGRLVAKDDYQAIAMDAVSAHQITMLKGPAGSGKSLIAFNYMFSLLEKGKIDKIIVFCNTVATKGSAKLGFYPGSRTEKLLDSQIGNLLVSKLGDRIAVEKLIEDGSLVLLPMSDIRGFDTTGMNAAVYLSEAQNLNIDLMKLALQRIGDDSICIIDGDDKAQVDLDMYAGNNNGMRRASKVFRGNENYAEVTMKNIYRSKIGAIAEQM